MASNDNVLGYVVAENNPGRALLFHYAPELENHAQGCSEMHEEIISPAVATILWYALYFEGGVLALIVGYVVARLRTAKKRLDTEE